MDVLIPQTIVAAATVVAEVQNDVLVATRLNGSTVTIIFAAVKDVAGLAEHLRERAADTDALYVTVVLWGEGRAIATTAPNRREARATAYHYHDELDGQ